MVAVAVAVAVAAAPPAPSLTLLDEAGTGEVDESGGEATGDAGGARVAVDVAMRDVELPTTSDTGVAVVVAVVVPVAVDVDVPVEVSVAVPTDVAMGVALPTGTSRLSVLALVGVGNVWMFGDVDADGVSRLLADRDADGVPDSNVVCEAVVVNVAVGVVVAGAGSSEAPRLRDVVTVLDALTFTVTLRDLLGVSVRDAVGEALRDTEMETERVLGLSVGDTEREAVTDRVSVGVADERTANAIAFARVTFPSKNMSTEVIAAWWTSTAR